MDVTFEQLLPLSVSSELSVGPPLPQLMANVVDVGYQLGQCRYTVWKLMSIRKNTIGNKISAKFNLFVFMFQRSEFMIKRRTSGGIFS